MFITKKEYDRVNARNVKLAREVRDLNEENKYLHEENRDLRNENEDLRDTINNISKLAESNTYSNAEAVLGKIKESVNNLQRAN